MDKLELQSEATAFFDDFVTAFRTFSGAEIAARYLVPYLARQADGSLACHASQAAVVDYFQSVVDGYHAQGCRACRYKDLVVTAVDGQCSFATVTWELLREDTSKLHAWRESYLLAREPTGLRIFGSVDHID